MNNSVYYENYPASTLVLSVGTTLALYASGIIVMRKAGWIWSLLYFAYILVLEIKLLRSSCRNCFYYGKICAFVRGKLCSLFFKPGNPQNFTENKVTWVKILPDLLVSLVPVLTGILLILIDFDWILLAIILLILFLTTAGNGYIRGRLACRYCKQKEIGCPAMGFFSPNKTQAGKGFANSV